MNTEKKIIVVGSGGIGKVAALIAAHMPNAQVEKMTIDEMIERDKSIKYIAPPPLPELTLIASDYNPNALSARAKRRKAERDAKKRNKR